MDQCEQYLGRKLERSRSVSLTSSRHVASVRRTSPPFLKRRPAGNADALCAQVVVTTWISPSRSITLTDTSPGVRLISTLTRASPSDRLRKVRLSRKSGKSG